jgi:hypothetical protein
MDRSRDKRSAPDDFGQNDPSVRSWLDENLGDLRRTASGERPLYWLFALTLVVGLGAYAGGYLLKAKVTTGPLGLLADLLYTLGWALWTGAVVVVLLQIIPEVKRRQIKRALEAYKAQRREEAQALRDEPTGDGTPAAGSGEPGPPQGAKPRHTRTRIKRR